MKDCTKCNIVERRATSGVSIHAARGYQNTGILIYSTRQIQSGHYSSFLRRETVQKFSVYREVELQSRLNRVKNLPS